MKIFFKEELSPLLKCILAWSVYFIPVLLINPSAQTAILFILSAYVFFPLSRSKLTLIGSATILSIINIINLSHNEFLGAPADEFFFATSARSTLQESLEFFRATHISDFFWPILWLAFASAAYIYLSNQIALQSNQSTKLTRHIALTIPATIWAIFVLSGITQKYTLEKYFSRLKYIYPTPFFSSLYRYANIDRGFFYKPLLVGTSSSSPLANTIVAVIGESSTAHRWTILGYKNEETTRALDIPGLSVQTVMANGPNTATTLPYLLTGMSAAESVKNFAPSFIDIAKARGYKTFVYSNSRFYSSHEDFYSQAFRRSADIYKKVGDGDLDEILTPYLIKSLEDASPLKLIVLHTYGSHPYVEHRYPSNAYKGTDPYNNSIRYTTDLLAQWIGIVDSKSKNPSLLIYTSDHGVDTPPCIDGYRQGTSRSTYEIPTIIWQNLAMRDSSENWIKNYSTDDPLIPRHSSTLFPELIVKATGSDAKRISPNFPKSDDLMLNGQNYNELRPNIKSCN